ncbi:hypothetical protein FB480_102285 [Agrobacterium vitis]|nr:hypothetical protein FB480_102285 [Agrobacterium vitis]
MFTLCDMKNKSKIWIILFVLISLPQYIYFMTDLLSFLSFLITIESIFIYIYLRYILKKLFCKNLT